MHIDIKDIFVFLISFFSGGGLGLLAVKLFIQQQAKAAVEKDLEDIKGTLKDFVDCKFCNMQHENLNVLLKTMNNKLDILLEKF